jgi:serine/threonine-protein kinase HipA
VGIDQRDSTLSNAMSQCELFGYTPVQAAAEVAQVIKVVNGWREHFARYGVTQSDLESLAERIDGDPLLSQRRMFNPAEYTTARKPKRRRPFAR